MLRGFRIRGTLQTRFARDPFSASSVDAVIRPTCCLNPSGVSRQEGRMAGRKLAPGKPANVRLPVLIHRHDFNARAGKFSDAVMRWDGKGKAQPKASASCPWR